VTLSVTQCMMICKTRYGSADGLVLFLNDQESWSCVLCFCLPNEPIIGSPNGRCSEV
jgi:hypothetical protein